MWPDMPEQRLDYVKWRQGELISEAAASRLIARRTAHRGHNFAGLRIRLGSVLIMIGRTLCGEGAVGHDPAHS
jgi:hypothetical protein